MVKWNTKGVEGEKLISLLTQGTIDYKNLERKYILEVKGNYPEVFGRFADDRFIANYKKVVREFAVHKSLQGKRSASQAKVDDEAEEEGTRQEEEEEEEEAEELEEQEAEELEEDDTDYLADMATPKKQDSVQHLEERMRKASIATPNRNDKLEVHKIMYTYLNEEGIECVVVHFEAPSSTMQVESKVKNQKMLEVEFKMTPILLNSNWLKVQQDLQVTANVQNAYKQAVASLREERATYSKLCIKLPFAVEAEPTFRPKLACFKEGNPTHTVTKIITLEFRSLYRTPSITTVHNMNVFEVNDLNQGELPEIVYQASESASQGARSTSGSASSGARSTVTPSSAPRKRPAYGDSNAMVES